MSMKTKIFNAHLNPASHTYILDVDNTTPLELAINQFFSNLSIVPFQVTQSQSSTVVNSVTTCTNITVTVFYSYK